MLRIIAGALGGRYVDSPSGRAVRPTSETAREALFSSLAARTPGSLFLDMFAGTGMAGIEALSRGASFALFIDNNKERCARLTAALNKLSLSDRAHVARADATDARAVVASYEAARFMIARRRIAIGADAEDSAIAEDSSVAEDSAIAAPKFAIAFADPPYDMPGAAETPKAIGELPFLGDDAVIVFEHSFRLAAPREAGAFELVKERKYGEAMMSYYERSGFGELVIR